MDNQETGEAGGIFVEVYRDIFILDGGTLSATTTSSEGGDIDLSTGNFLVLGDNGGNLDIISPYVISVPLDDNITAQAYARNGGGLKSTPIAFMRSHIMTLISCPLTEPNMPKAPTYTEAQR